MGSLLAYSVYKATGEHPLCIVRRETQFELLKEKGIIIEWPDHKVETIPVNPILVKTSQNIIRKCDLVIITVKSYDLEPAIKLAKELAKDPESIGILVNGLAGYTESKQEGINPFFLVSDYGVTRISDNKIVVKGLGSIYLGYSPMLSENVPLNGDVLEYVSEIFEKGGLNILPVDNIDFYRWRKTAVNAGINPVTAILGAKNRIVLDNKWARLLSENAAKEIVRIANAYGIKLDLNDTITYVFEVALRTGENLSSMLQDLLNCKKTEVDSILGVPLVLAKGCNINAGTIEHLYILIKALEEGRTRCAEKK